MRPRVLWQKITSSRWELLPCSTHRSGYAARLSAFCVMSTRALLATGSAEEIDFVSALASMVSLALEESSRAHSEHLLRESEERFSKAFHASPVNITILRLSDKKFIEANDAFVRWFGLSRDKILGHDSRELGIWVNLDDRVRFLADLERDGSLREVECQLRSWRGTVHTIVQ